ncbi:hypothetical protein G6011_10687 [Alternaria panax]|uniref:Uncharacterized protein n=1 Tax=Alternaria panax TaxID=48097 RepID=A0AAD4ICC7_9PLEO|nr:hypothetical protein G6011_10687 [Alternaria panax]
MHHKHKDKSQHFSMRSFLHKMETRRLRNSDMKKLVRIFRRVPAPTEKRYEHKETLYHEHTKAAIQRLPSRLRSSRLSFGLTNLCSHHHGLNQNLVDDIWSWIHHEFDKAIGRFLFPLIMSHGLLTADQKSQIRQLEPVLQMWQPDFNVEASAPPGHEPIQCESKWHYQQDQCKACMLARIGTHEHVLFVLFAGMVGRFNTKTFTTMDALRSVAGRDSIKSKRLRFVRYWVRKTLGDTALLRAADLGLELKHLRLQWKYEQQRQPQLLSHIRMQKTPNRTLEQRPPTAAETFHRRPFGNSAISTADSQQYHQAAVPKLFDPKLGPNPRPPDVERLSPAEDMGFELELSSMRERTYTVPKDQKDIHPALRRYPASALLRSPTNASKRSNETRGSSDSEHTFRPGDSMSDDSPHPGLLHPAYLRADSVLNIAPSNPSCASTKLYAPSVATTRTIASYNGGPSSRANHVDPLDNPIYNHIETQEERVEKYRRLLATRSDSDPFAEYEDEAIALPKPQRQSMYSAWGDVAFDGSRFDKIDEEIAEDEIGNWEKDKSDDDDDDDDEIFCEENMGEHG